MKIDRHKAFNLYCERNEKTFKFNNCKRVSEIMGVTYHGVRDLCTKYKWLENREKTLKKRAEKARKYIDEQSAKMEAENYKMFGDGKNLLKECMKDLEKKLKEEGKISPWAIKETMSAMETVNKQQRVICNLPTEINRGEITNINKEVPLSDEEMKKINKEMEKANKK